MSCNRRTAPLSRREALCRMGNGFGIMAFAGLLGESLAKAGVTAGADGNLSTPYKLDYPQKVKRVIFLFMNGGCSSIDSFDHKPELAKYAGQPLPGGHISTERKTGTLMPSPFEWKRYGKSGIEISELFPNLGEVADDICWIRSVYTDIPNHEPAILMMNTGFSQAGRPAIGSWLTYGLGTDNQNLPGYVVLCPDVPTTVGPPLWSNGFLPAMNQGTFIADKVAEKQTAESVIGKEFDPKKLISFINNQKFSLSEQRRELTLLEQLEQVRKPDPQVDAVVKSMEVAYRMQTEAPEVFDIRQETAATQKMYGPGSTARSCLMAVRLVEKGVRMVQVYYAKGDPWDAHADIQAHRKNAKDSDQPFAAVIKDLKARGMWDDTLVVIGSEFGRTPVKEVGGGGGGTQNGRDHNPFGFTVALAGGAVKGGTTYGATDEFGFKAVEKPMHVHDLHATILYLMGIDHKKLTYRYSGRDFRLTDVSGNIVKEVCA